MSVIANYTGNIIQADGISSSGTQALTATGNAGTATSQMVKITTPSLATAAGASQAETITLSGVTASNMAQVTFGGGTNTTWGGVTAVAVCTSNTVTITIYNGNAAALNGTVILNLMVV